MNPLQDADEDDMPCYPEAALAGTLALMTCHVQCAEASCRDELARHVLRNLTKLSAHPMLSEHFRVLLRGLQERWEVQLQNQSEMARFARQAPGDDVLWMPPPRHVQ